MNGLPFQEKIEREARASRRARKILGVGEGASPGEIKRAWRRACLETHPDRNRGDPDARGRFCLVHCAYHCLTDGTLCEELLSETKDSADAPRNGQYNLANQWGFYLWWREKFFE